MAALYAFGSIVESSGNVSHVTSSPYGSAMHRAMWLRISGYLVPFTPHMASLPTLFRLRMSIMLSATTPAPLSLSEAAPFPPTYPVVYSPVPITRTSATAAFFLLLASLDDDDRDDSSSCRWSNDDMDLLCLLA